MIRKDNREVLSDREVEELINSLKLNSRSSRPVPPSSRTVAPPQRSSARSHQNVPRTPVPRNPSFEEEFYPGNASRCSSDRRQAAGNRKNRPAASVAGPSRRHPVNVSAAQALPKQSGLAVFVKTTAVAVMLLLSAWLLSSGGKMKLASVTVSAKDRDALFSAASGNLLSEALVEIHEIPKVYILERNDEPTPVPAQENFTKIEDPERKNYDGTPIDYYKDPTIEVKCWKEKTKGVIFNYAEVTIADASQFRRKLVHDVVSKKHLDFPSSTFKKMHGVVGMSSDYCAFRSYGTIVQNGNIVRDKIGDFMDLMIVDKDANLTYVLDRDFAKSKYYNSEDLVYTFAFGPMIVNDYKVNSSRDKMTGYPIGEPSHRYPRAAIAQFDYDKHYLLCTVDYPGLTLVEFANVVQSKGVRFAYNLDGGQTAAMMFNNQLFNEVAYGGEREISDIVFFATAIPNE